MEKAMEVAKIFTTQTKTKDAPRIVTVMRVKNEEKYLAYALDSLRALGGRVVLLDDGSDDATPDIAQGFDFVDYHRQDIEPMDEGPARTKMYQLALELEPEWIFTLDGDEALDPMCAERMLRAMDMAPDDVNVFDMFLAVMATSPEVPRQLRYAGASPMAYWSMGRLFRVRDAHREHEFYSKAPFNLHCGCVPEMYDRKSEKLNAWLLYYGYESKEAVAKKRVFYMEHDPARLPQSEAMWRARAKCGRVGIGKGVDAREIGITRTVTY
jgi:glycosyltransferase involved in cell wall biosynthesis